METYTQIAHPCLNYFGICLSIPNNIKISRGFLRFYQIFCDKLLAVRFVAITRQLTRLAVAVLF